MTTLEFVVERLGLSLSSLARQSDALILFGSRAAEMARSDSDWDLLVIGAGQTRVSVGLDLIFVAPSRFEHWRCSELATHVGRWGRTIHGSETWLNSLAAANISHAAVKGKRRRLLAQLSADERYWSRLPLWARAERARKFRRDLQRFERLDRGVPVPPSAVLDLEWSSPNGTSFRALLERAGLRERARWMEVAYNRRSLHGVTEGSVM